MLFHLQEFYRGYTGDHLPDDAALPNVDPANLQTLISADPAFSRKFANLKKIGDGAFGEVFQADDLALGWPVAIKVLARVLGTAAVTLHRFRREFATIARLGYPGVVQVYQYGAVLGFPYFSMELLQGRTLREETIQLTGGHGVAGLADQAGAMRLLLSVFAQSLAALGYVHFHRIIHRDIKPENIWVTPQGQVKLLDFGLVLPLDRSLSLTGSDYFLGTINYVAPEQIEAVEIDGRADLYSLATVMYEAFAGALPFPSARGWGLIHLKISQRPRTLRSYWPQADPELDAVLMRMLDPDITKRFATAERILAALGPVFARWGMNGHGAEPFAAEAQGGSSTARLFRPQFVGRGDELNRLESLINQRHGCRLVVLDGPEGIGKTRIIQELRRRHLFDGTVFVAASASGEQGGAPPVEQLVRELAAAVAQQEPERLQNGPLTPALIQAFPALKKVAGLAALPEATVLEPGEARNRLLQAVIDLICDCGRGRTLVLAFDDLSLAEPATGALLLDLARRISFGVPGNIERGNVVVILSRRTDGSEQCELWQPLLTVNDGDSSVLRFELPPFSDGESAMLVQSMLGLEYTPAGLAADVGKQCGGIPLYMEETVRGLVDEGWLRYEAGGWRAGQQDIAVSANGALSVADFFENITTIRRLRDILVRRLNELSGECQATCEAAAILGPTFQLDHVTALSGDPEDQVLAALDEMIRRRILVEHQPREATAGAAPVEAGYRFASRPLWQAAYGQIADRRRQDLHLRAAHLLRPQRADSGTWEAVANHLVSGGDREQALEECLMAAAQPGVTGTARVIPFLSLAVKLGRELGREASLVPAMWELARAHDAITTNQESTDLYRSIVRLGGPPGILGGAYAELGLHSYMLRDFNTARDLLTRSRELLAPLPFSLEMATLHFHWAQLYRDTGDIDAAVRECLAGLAGLSEEVSSWYASRLRNCLGLCYMRQGQLEEAEHQLKLALDHAVGIGHFALSLTAINSLFTIMWNQGRSEEALPMAEEYIVRGRRAMATAGLMRLMNNVAYAYNQLGNPQAARKYAAELLELARTAGDPHMEARALMALGHAAETLQQFDVAFDCHQRGLNITIKLGDRSEQAYFYANLGGLHHCAGRWAESLQMFQKARELMAEVSDNYGIGEMHRHMANVHISRGDIDSAEQEAALARKIFQQLRTAQELGWLTNIEGQILAARGHHPEARDLFQRAIEQAQSIKSIELEGAALRNLAIALFKLGENDSARETIRRSISLLDQNRCTGELAKSYAVAGLIFSRGTGLPNQFGS